MLTTRSHAAAPPRVRPVVVGGPFQRVVYNTVTHVTVAVPGLLREGPLYLRAPAIRYNDLTHLGWAEGNCLMGNGSATASSQVVTADFTRRVVTMTRGVQFHFSLRESGQAPVDVNLRCPAVTYWADSGVARGTGAVTGQILGLQQLPGAEVSRALAQTGGAPPPVARGPVNVHAAVVTFDPRSHQIHATGGVVLTRSDITVTCDQLLLDTARNTLRMSGRVGYSDGAGRRLSGSSAVDDLRRGSLLVVGPVTYTDRQRNIIHSTSATLSEKPVVVGFTGNVLYTTAQGMAVRTPWATIQVQPGGNQKIDTGPVSVVGTTASL